MWSISRVLSWARLWDPPWGVCARSQPRERPLDTSDNGALEQERDNAFQACARCQRREHRRGQPGQPELVHSERLASLVRKRREGR
jgi:5-methylcytosine-specific restriction endonuclease McrA